MKKILKSYENYILLLIIIVTSFLINADLFHEGFPITHDGQDHIARIANFYNNLREGVFIPRWAANLNWGYGHPILMFLYPLPSYIASFFHSLGFSFIDSTKIVFGLGITLSGITMYLWLSEFLDKKSGFIGAILYMFTPYRFVELYVRGDIGENLAFIFPPLVLYYLLKLSREMNYKHIVLGSISLAGLILSHNAVSLMFMPFIVFYSIYLLSLVKKKRLYIVNALLLLLLGFGLSAFFWIPGLFEGKYTLRNIVTAGEYASRFIDFNKLFYGTWSYGIAGQFSLQMGLINIFVLTLSPLVVYFFYKKKDKKYLLAIVLLAYTFLSIFLMLKQSLFIWQKIMILQNFQFPWRFIYITVFTTSVLAGFLVSIIPKKIQSICIVVLFITILFLNKDYWHANNYLYKNDSFFTSIYRSTTDTGESAPIWSVRFMEKTPEKSIEVINGKAEINEIKRSTTRHEYKISANTETRIRENTLYFPGWRVFVDDKSANIEFQDPQNRGLITFNVPNGVHNVLVEFSKTKLRIFSDLISLFSIISLFIIILLSRFKVSKIIKIL